MQFNLCIGNIGFEELFFKVLIIIRLTPVFSFSVFCFPHKTLGTLFRTQGKIDVNLFRVEVSHWGEPALFLLSANRNLKCIFFTNVLLYNNQVYFPRV